MKKNFTIIYCALSLFTATAQPVITSGNIYPGAGQYEVHQDVLTNGINEGPAGANQTWDFSNAIDNTDPPDTTFYYNSSSTPFASLFPMSNLAYQFGTGGYYGYTTLNSNFAEVNGAVFNVFNDTAIYYYVDPIRLWEFPCTYNSMLSDPFEMIVPPFELLPGEFHSVHAVGTISYLADGYGTLITPTGTCNSALRVKVRIAQVDSNFTTGTTNLTEVDQHFQTQFAWICANGCFDFNITYDTTISSTGTSTQISALYKLYCSPVGISVTENKDIKFSISPNPVKDILSVAFPDQKINSSFLSIYDIIGKIAYETTFNNQTTTTIDVSTLPSGIYFIKLQNEKETVMKKFIKE